MENGISASVPTHIRPWLRCGEKGEILLASSAGLYIKFGERIVLLCDKAWGTLPIGIGADDFNQMVCLLRLQQGQKVTVAENCLQFPGGSVRLVFLDAPLETASVAAPRQRCIRQAAEALAALHKERGISMLVMPLILGRDLEDGWRKNPYCTYARLYFGKLLDAFVRLDEAEIRSCIPKLLGLGPGLTPSADDAILGMLYVFRALSRENSELTQMFQSCVRQLCDRCTNQISAAYLKAIAEGAPFARMETVFRGLCGEEPLDIQQLTQIGSSSGSEMLLGMLIALRICGYDVSQMEELP